MVLLSVAEALERVTRGLTPLDKERVALDRGTGACWQRISPRGSPSRRSMLRPWWHAVRAADGRFLPATLRLVGNAAGAGYRAAWDTASDTHFHRRAGSDGADTIVIQENADESESVTVKELSPVPHIVRASGLFRGRGPARGRDQARPARADARRRYEPCRIAGQAEA